MESLITVERKMKTILIDKGVSASRYKVKPYLLLLQLLIWRIIMIAKAAVCALNINFLSPKADYNTGHFDSCSES